MTTKYPDHHPRPNFPTVIANALEEPTKLAPQNGMGEVQSKKPNSQPDFNVNPILVGYAGNEIPLKVSVRPDIFDGIKISGVPDDVTINVGRPVLSGTYFVDHRDLSRLCVNAAARSDSDFLMAITPTLNGTVYHEQTKTVNVYVRSESRFVEISSFGIVTGNQGKIPIRIADDHTDINETCDLTFKELPNYLTFSQGERQNKNWHIQSANLNDLIIHATYVNDTRNWTPYYHYLYKSTEISYEYNHSQNNIHEFGKFQLYVFQD